MRRFLFLMMLACFCNCTFAQSVVTGVVRDTTGTNLEGVIVRINADKATLGFARTAENGSYSSVPSWSRAVVLASVRVALSKS